VILEMQAGTDLSTASVPQRSMDCRLHQIGWSQATLTCQVYRHITTLQRHFEGVSILLLCFSSELLKKNTPNRCSRRDESPPHVVYPSYPDNPNAVRTKRIYIEK